jgi:hypothetical protein
VYGIVPQNDTNFWISTNFGLSNFQWNANTFSKNEPISINHYDDKNGLQGNEFNTNSYLKLNDGSIAFGGIDGVNLFKGEDIIKSKETLPVIISEFIVFNGKKIDDTLSAYKQQYDLTYKENNFSIAYNTLGFTVPSKTNYYYRMIGYNDQWLFAGNRTYVSYTNLSSGDYIFEVKACNYDGYCSETATQLKIHIQTPFFRTWFFYTLLGILTLFIFYKIYTNRINLVKKEEELKLDIATQISELKMKALRAQINPHFLFNSLNSINSFILKNENKLASKYIVKFSKLVRNILSNSSVTELSLDEELNTITLYLEIESMRFDNQFSHEIQVDKIVELNNIKIPSLLLQPYIENAIWHGLLHKVGSKKIIIRITQLEIEILKIEIEDNGIGRDESIKLNKTHSEKSKGMEIDEERLQLFDKNTKQVKLQVVDLMDINKKPIGTRIEIKLPI